MRFIDLIAKKKLGQEHTSEELRFIANSAARADVPDYQLSAWLMAERWQGMSENETAIFTRAMAESGDILDLKNSRAPRIDKHSTGGVGDGVSLVLAPLLAEAGIIVPMMSGRGLGHTGGTLDKLESIPGFQVRLSKRAIESQLKKIGVCLFGQNETIAPADKKLYHLRDATSTVDSPPLIVSSILSKKIAESLNGLVLDVKVGSGAIFKTQTDAEFLARALLKTSKRLGLRSVAVLTAMEEPLGFAVGNALEVKQAIEILNGDFSARDFVECALTLGGLALSLGGLAKNAEDGMSKLEKLLKNGRALERMRKIIRHQGGDVRVLEDTGRLPKARRTRTLKAQRSGFIQTLDARKTGEAAILLGAGRNSAEDKIDYGAGILLFKKRGDFVKAGESVAAFYASETKKIDEALAHFKDGFAVTDRRHKSAPVVLKILN